MFPFLYLEQVLNSSIRGKNSTRTTAKHAKYPNLRAFRSALLTDLLRHLWANVKKAR